MTLSDADCEQGIRSVLAAVAMHALLSNGKADHTWPTVAELAVNYADSLLAELSKPRVP